MKKEKKGRKKEEKYERSMKKCQGTHKKEIFPHFEKRLRFFSYLQLFFLPFYGKWMKWMTKLTFLLLTFVTNVQPN